MTKVSTLKYLTPSDDLPSLATMDSGLPWLTQHSPLGTVLLSFQLCVEDYPRVVDSRDHGGRLKRDAVDTIVMHATAGDTLDGAWGWLWGREQTGSYHYAIDRGEDAATRRIVRWLPRDKVAYHAGRSAWPLPPRVPGTRSTYLWRPRQSLNGRSIGIVFVNRNMPLDHPTAGDDLSPWQIAAALWLVVVSHGWFPRLTPDRVRAHWEVAPDRKTDPHPSLLHMPDFRTAVRLNRAALGYGPPEV